ncbi:alpha/beta hydrolase [Halovulum sp. GXIMD14793]
MLWRLADHDLGHWQSEVFDFTAGETRLTGTLWQPGSPPVAAVVLVHGDGPQDRSLQGGYAPMINMLLESGIAVASWDKPGVGSSSGN